MQIKTILNSIEKYQSFIYGPITWGDDPEVPFLEIQIFPRKNGRAICSKCNTQQPSYDKLASRKYQYQSVWGILVFFVYSPRRVSCCRCKAVKVEHVPWATGKNCLTNRYAWFLANWAKRLSWKETAEMFNTTWGHVYSSVKMAVQWGLSNRKLDHVKSIGVDEVAWRSGHKYLTLVYQIDENQKRLLWIGKDRTEKTFLRFFEWFGEERSDNLKHVCSDMWKPYLKVIKAKASNALNILDRFHVMTYFSKAIDKVRAAEAKRLFVDDFEPVLKKSRWLFLRNPENLNGKQGLALKTLLGYNLKTVRAYLLKEEFQFFWKYVSPIWAGKFIDAWCTKTMRSKIDPMKDVAKMLRRHKPLLMNWFKAKGRMSSGIVEGFNTKVKLTTRKAYGFRTYNCAEIALYHCLGALPTPKFTHKFF